MTTSDVTSHKLRVFLCHSSGDKPIVRDLYHKLRDDGFEPWLDEEDLLPGQDWRREIPLAVRNSDIVVVCLSKASITKAGYVQNEIKFALDVADMQPEGTIFIIPVKLEECEMPERLSRWQWVNLFQPNGYERLVRSLKRRLSTMVASTSPTIGDKGVVAEQRPVGEIITRPTAAQSETIPVRTDSNSKKRGDIRELEPHNDLSIQSNIIEQPLSPKIYIALSAIGLGIAIALLLLYVMMAPSLIKNGIDTKVFYFLLVPLGLGSAAFIFGAMRSYARYEHTQLPHKLELGGPILGAALVVLGGFYLTPSADTFNITVRAFSQSGEPIQSGNITIYLSQDARSAPIASNGEANFKEIPSKFRNAKVQVRADVKGYKLTTSEQVLTDVINLQFRSVKEDPAGKSEPISANSLENQSFQTVVTDENGQIRERKSKEARVFAEDLGNGVKLEMVEIPAGTFKMGINDIEAQSVAGEFKKYDVRPLQISPAQETPQHDVTIPSLYVGKFEITQAQWKAVVSQVPAINRDLPDNPSYFKGDDLPVEGVSWRYAMEFCDRLYRLTGRRYRLPSEAEWEYACRANTATPFSFGKNIQPEIVNYDGNYPFGAAPKGLYRGQTIPVGSIGVANAFGLYDMSGNVWEWCLDLWHKDYKGNPPIDNQPWYQDGVEQYRVVRGGSWWWMALGARSTYRIDREETETSDPKHNHGFRVVLDK